MKSTRQTRSERRTHVEPLEGRLLLHAGDPDPSFGFGGLTNVSFGGYSAENPMLDVANGRTVLGYSLGSGAGDTFVPSRVGIAVLDGAGNPVKSFSDDGFKTQALSATGRLRDMVVQPDNKVLVIIRTAAGTSLLARFNADGSLDSGFGQKTISLAEADDIAVTPAGDVIVAGRNGIQPAGRVTLLRYGPTGAFKSQLVTGLAAGVRDIAVQGDGKPVVITAIDAPGATSPDGVWPSAAAVLRVRADFTGLDTTFDGDGMKVLPTQQVYPGDENPPTGGEIEIDGQGRIVAAISESYQTTSIFRLMPSNGAIDPTFKLTQHLGFSVSDLAISSNGKITVSGYLLAQGESLVRLNPNGDTDTGFGENGWLGRTDAYYEPQWITYRHDVQPDGRVVTGTSGIFRLAADDATPVGSVNVTSDGVMHITGTAGRDDIGIYAASGFVEINHRFAVRYGFPVAVTRIEINTLAGNDRVDNSVYAYGQYEESPDDLPRTIHGGAGNDYLEGAGGKDTIAAEDGNDVIHGNGGDDTIIDGPGTDLNDGGLGADTVDYSFRSGPVYVDLAGDADDGPAGEHDTVATSIEQIIGSKGNDTLVGDGRPNYIDGRGGNDTIYGGGGNDTLVGGLGQDKLYGQDGNDFLDARDGITDLVLDGGAGTDTARKDNSDPRTSIEVLFNS